jgi:hypothetical protein
MFEVLKILQLKSWLLYSDTYRQRHLTSTAVQVGRLQVRRTHGTAHTVANDGLALSHPPLQLV